MEEERNRARSRESWVGWWRVGGSTAVELRFETWVRCTSGALPAIAVDRLVGSRKTNDFNCDVDYNPAMPARDTALHGTSKTIKQHQASSCPV